MEGNKTEKRNEIVVVLILFTHMCFVEDMIGDKGKRDKLGFMVIVIIIINCILSYIPIVNRMCRVMKISCLKSKYTRAIKRLAEKRKLVRKERKRVKKENKIQKAIASEMRKNLEQR